MRLGFGFLVLSSPFLGDRLFDRPSTLKFFQYVIDDFRSNMDDITIILLQFFGCFCLCASAESKNHFV